MTAIRVITDDELISLARAVVYAQEQGADDDLPEALAALREAFADKMPLCDYSTLDGPCGCRAGHEGVHMGRSDS